MKKYSQWIFALIFFCSGFMNIHSARSAEISKCPSIIQFFLAPMNIARGLSGNDTLQCISTSREKVYADIYKYTYILQTDHGAYDKIGIYRVVRESRRNIPITTDNAVFMIHGDYSSFDLFIMPPETRPENQAMGIYLAQKDMDVWGIDLRWALLPEDLEDFSFMKDWNTRTHLDDIKIAVKFARMIRALTGSGYGKIILSGFSRGVQYVYAYANEDSQLPRGRQDLKGIIPMASQFKASLESDEIIKAARGRYDVVKSLYASGRYYSDEGLGLKYLAHLALTDPDGMSETITGLTNRETMLFMASATFDTFVPPEGPYTPFYHFTAGLFDESGIPYDLAFTDESYLMDIILKIPGYQSIGEIIEGEALLGDFEDLPYDDHLHDIIIPVLYVGAAGGEGEYGKYTLSLLGSRDTSSLVVGMYPPASVKEDFGHLDLLTAEDADVLVWEPVYQWIVSH